MIGHQLRAALPALALLIGGGSALPVQASQDGHSAEPALTIVESRPGSAPAAPLSVAPTLRLSGSPNPATSSATRAALNGNPDSDRLAGVWTSAVDVPTSNDLASLGLGWARVTLRWSDIQPTSSSMFDWSAADQSVVAASAHGSRRVLLQVRNNPAWAAASRCKVSSDPERANLANFLGVLVRRYMGTIPVSNGAVANVKYWQLYNEADNTSLAEDQNFDLGGCFGTHDGSFNATSAGRVSYAQMLDSVGLAIHTADPNSFVVLSGVASGNYTPGQPPACPTTDACPFDAGFATGVVAALQASSTLDRLDMLAVHYFSSQAGVIGNASQPDLIGRVESLRNGMRSLGLTDTQLKPIVVDEGSYTSSQGVSTSSPTDAFNLNQRDYLVKALARAMYERVEAYLWFWLQDPTGGGLGSDNAYGLRAVDGGAKPAYLAMQRFSSLLDQRSRFNGKLGLPSPGLEGYQFQLVDGRRARLVWNEADSRSLPYNVSDGLVVQATDGSGGAVTVVDNTAQIGPSPVYLILGTPQVCRPTSVHIVADPTGDGRLSVTVGASSSTLPIASLQFQSGNNALVDISGQTGRSGAFSVTLPDGSFSPTFFVRRAVAGQPTTLPFSVIDACGSWGTFVGGGPNAF